MSGTRQSFCILDELNSKPMAIEELSRWVKQTRHLTVAEEVQRQLRNHTQRSLPVVIDEVSNCQHLKIERLPIEDLKLTHDIRKRHGAECTCIVCKLPKAPKTGRWSASADNGG